MGKKSFVFVVDQSVIFKISDVNYKIGVYSKNSSLFFLSTPLLKVRFLVISLTNNSNLNLANTRALVGICSQIYEVFILKFNKVLGSPNEAEKITFFQSGRSKVLNYFWFYCPDLSSQKLIPAGLSGNFFFFLRLFILDIFGLFGAGFYEEFYINYFGFSEIFAFDFFFSPAFVNQETNIKRRFFQLKNFLTFFKIFSFLIRYVCVYYFLVSIM